MRRRSRDVTRHGTSRPLNHIWFLSLRHDILGSNPAQRGWASELPCWATRAVSYFDQAPFDVRCEWGLPGIEQIANSDVIILVDVLSFTTSVDIAVCRGATIYPYRWNDETAITYALDRGAEVASSRSRFDGRFSLAPSSLVEVPAGLRLVLPSPNGSSLALRAMSTGAVVVAGCLAMHPPLPSGAIRGSEDHRRACG